MVRYLSHGSNCKTTRTVVYSYNYHLATNVYVLLFAGSGIYACRSILKINPDLRYSDAIRRRHPLPVRRSLLDLPRSRRNTLAISPTLRKNHFSSSGCTNSARGRTNTAKVVPWTSTIEKTTSVVEKPRRDVK
jgi:hypothetical protein